MNIKRFAVFSLCICLLIVGFSTARAFCLPRPQPKIDSPNDYMLTLADTLVLFRTARDRSKEIKSAGSPMELIAVLKTADQDYGCAKSYVVPYAKSKNEAVATSVNGMDSSLTMLAAINDIFLQRYKQSLDGKSEKSSVHEETNAELMMMGKEAWSIEMTAATAACLALIEFEPVTKKPRLTLTARERSELIKRLEKNFGQLLAKKADGLLPLENSVAVILDFLRDRKRKSHDDR